MRTAARLVGFLMLAPAASALSGAPVESQGSGPGTQRKPVNASQPATAPVEDRLASAMKSVVLVEFVVNIEMSGMSGQTGVKPFQKKVYGVVLDKHGRVLIAGDYGLGDMMVVPGMERAVSSPEKIVVRPGGGDKPLPARFIRRDAERDLAIIQVTEGAEQLTPLDLRTARRPRKGEKAAVVIGKQPDLFWSRAEKQTGESKQVVKVELRDEVTAPSDMVIFPLPRERRWHINSEGLAAYSEQGQLLGVIAYVKMPQPEKVSRPGFGHYAVVPAEYFPAAEGAEEGHRTEGTPSRAPGDEP